MQEILVENTNKLMHKILKLNKLYDEIYLKGCITIHDALKLGIETSEFSSLVQTNFRGVIPLEILNRIRNSTIRHEISVGIVTIYYMQQMQKYMKSANPDIHDYFEEIYLAAILHDIGKSSIDQDVLYKEGRLTGEEFDHIKRHTDVGYDMIKNIGISMKIVSDVCRFHHLKSGGYPCDASGERINYYVDIVSIVDIFCATAQKRVYHEYHKPYAEVYYILTHTRANYPTVLTQAILSILPIFKNGDILMSSDEQMYTVTSIDPFNNVTLERISDKVNFYLKDNDLKIVCIFQSKEDLDLILDMMEKDEKILDRVFSERQTLEKWYQKLVNILSGTHKRIKAFI